MMEAERRTNVNASISRLVDKSDGCAAATKQPDHDHLGIRKAGRACIMQTLLHVCKQHGICVVLSQLMSHGHLIAAQVTSYTCTLGQSCCQLGDDLNSKVQGHDCMMEAFHSSSALHLNQIIFSMHVAAADSGNQSSPLGWPGLPRRLPCSLQSPGHIPRANTNRCEQRSSKWGSKLAAMTSARTPWEGCEGEKPLARSRSVAGQPSLRPILSGGLWVWGPTRIDQILLTKAAQADMLAAHCCFPLTIRTWQLWCLTGQFAHPFHSAYHSGQMRGCYRVHDLRQAHRMGACMTERAHEGF